MRNPSFRGNVVIITGASSGIGRELAYLMASEGARLALAARNERELETVAERCRQRGAQALAVPTDVAEPEQCRRLIEDTVGQFGRIDTLVNNAGISMWARFEEFKDLAPLERIMRVNFLGSLYCTHYALPHLKKTRGRIVGVASLTGKVGVPTRSVYCASKHAMAGFYDSLRIEEAPQGVSVTMVYPGFVESAVRHRAVGADGNPMGRNPLKAEKMMSAETCARVILKAAAQRKREVVMTFRGKVSQWLKLFSPRLVDYFARKAIEKGS
ncbi:MAG: SDR family oxidoreductase [Acidobacteriota bacterium]